MKISPESADKLVQAVLDERGVDESEKTLECKFIQQINEPKVDIVKPVVDPLKDLKVIWWDPKVNNQSNTKMQKLFK